MLLLSVHVPALCTFVAGMTAAASFLSNPNRLRVALVHTTESA